MRAFYWSFLALTPLLAACSSPRPAPAPIIDGTAAISTTSTPTPAPNPVANPNTSANPSYVVKKGDTLYRIATEQKVSAQELMTWNKLSDSNIRIGQVLVLAPPLGDNGVTITPLADTAAVESKPSAGTIITKTTPKAIKEPYSASAAAAISATEDNKVATKQQSIASSMTASSVKPVPTIQAPQSSPNPNKSGATVASASATSNTTERQFGMPTSGKIIRGFSDESKGIDIAGKLGQSIVASAQGKVVYAGAGLRGYGKMVILQHSNGYLTAYAHNDKLLVKEGDVVKKGEKIAEMGKSDADQVKLHFEIRKGGKPIDPGKFIATE